MPLDLAAAAATPMFGTSQAAPLGLEQARALIGGLAKGDPCSAKATSAVQLALAAVERAAAGDRPKAKRVLAQVLASIEARRAVSASTATAPARSAARPGAPGREVPHRPCAEGAPPGRRQGRDYVQAARTAQKIKNEAASSKAIDGARDAYGSWAGKQLAGGGARTAGDFVSIARGGQMLGTEGVVEAAFDKARGGAAARDVDKAAEIDDCTATKDDVTCLAEAIAMAQALSADVGDASARLTRVNRAVEERLLEKISEGCEEWSFTMSLTSTAGYGPAGRASSATAFKATSTRVKG